MRVAQPSLNILPSHWASTRLPSGAPPLCDAFDNYLVTLERIEQGPQGQVSPKPTDLLAVRAPHLQRCYRRLKIPGRRPPPAKQYLEDGSFVTAPLKEYPSRMCALILASIWTSMKNPSDDEESFENMCGRPHWPLRRRRPRYLCWSYATRQHHAL